MDEDAFNMSIRKFLKKVGVTSQREIEQAVRDAVDSGALTGTETLKAKVALTIDGVKLDVVDRRRHRPDVTADSRLSSALDRPIARIAAVGVAAAAALTLAYIHRDDLFPPEAGSAGAATADPVMLCVAERSADIDGMVSDGTIDEARAALFKSRAEALCQSTVGGGNNAPPLPGQ